MTSSKTKTFALPVRVLVLISRSDDAGFIDPRSDAQALLGALADLGRQTEVEFLYPPTLKALTKRLRDKQAPPVHIVHFDGHGVYDASLGLGYLLFENSKHKSDRVDANRLGTLLNQCGVPLMVLSACQTAMQQESNPYASVAARLIRAGMGSVLAMNYSVLVPTTKKFVAAFYRSLVDGLTIGQAVDAGRFELLADAERFTFAHRDETGEWVEETVQLRDWFLPALYQQADDPVVFDTPSPPRRGWGRGGEGLPRTLTDPTSPGGLPPEPLHGFHGRAREMLQLERALAEHAVVVLHGFDGLGGHPLSLYLVLPHLRDYSPAELSARFEALLPGFTTGAAKERNESLAVSVEFSLRRLGEETLAALVTVETLRGIIPPFLTFHPTLLPYLAGHLDPERRTELESSYWQRYYGLAGYLYDTDTQHPHQARAIAHREMPNLRRAFELALAAAVASSSPPVATEAEQTSPPLGPVLSEVEGGIEGGPNQPDPTFIAVNFATSIAKFLDIFGRWRELDALLHQVENLEISADQGLTKAEYLRLSQTGEMLLQQGRAAEAEQLFRELLARVDAGAAYDAAYHRAMALCSLARCLAAQGRPAAAIDLDRRALEAFEAMSESVEQAMSQAGHVHADLADNSTVTGQFEEAKNHYEISLNIANQTDDLRSAGVALGQLGMLALERGDLAEAADRYTEALETFHTLGEPQAEAAAWHMLGHVAEGSKDWDQAERCHREGLKLEGRIGDTAGITKTYNQLGYIATEAGRLDEAERWCLRAIEGLEQTGQLHIAARAMNNLAIVYLNQGRLAEAEQYARQAVEIVEQHQIQAEVWAMYSLLAKIAAAQGRAGEATQWRRKEQESYAAYAGAAHQIRQYQPLIETVVAACQGNEEAKDYVEGEFPKMGAGGEEWAKNGAAIQRILQGERDIDILTNDLTRTGAYIIRTILAQLAGEQPPSSSPQRGEDSASLPLGGVSALHQP